MQFEVTWVYDSDIVYKVNTDKSKGYILFLFEHQSKPDKLMPFRILEYNIFLMRQHLKQGYKKLPIIIPFVFYHGSTSPYPYSVDISGCFEHPELGKNYLLKPFKLIDVTVIPDEELKKNIITAPLQIIMKYIYSKDLLPSLIYLAQEGILSKNADFDDGELLIHVINYIIKNGEVSNRKVFEEVLCASLEEKPRRKIMTILEQYQQEIRESYKTGLSQGKLEGVREGKLEGKLEGVREGKYKEKVKIARNMLSLSLPIEVISQATGLDKDQIAAIKTKKDVFSSDTVLH